MKKEKKEKNENYSNDVIVPLKGAQRVRLRPAVIFGSEGIDGCEAAFYGLFDNAVDEAKKGIADKITVSVTRDGVISIDDNGSGVPMGWNEEEKAWDWYLIFNELYAGSKFGGDLPGGLDACAAQYASEFMEIYSCDGENESFMRFEKGCPACELRVTPLEVPRTGTLICWKPDPEVFTHTSIPKEYFVRTMRASAMFVPGTKLVLDYLGERTEFCYNGGITDRVCEMAGDSRLTPPYLWKFSGTGRNREDHPDYTYNCEMALCVTDGGGAAEYYHDSREMAFGGSPRLAVGRAFAEYAEKYLRDCGRDGSVDGEKIFERLALICSTDSDRTVYTNGARNSVSGSFMESHMTKTVTELICGEFCRDPERAKEFFDALLRN